MAGEIQSNGGTASKHATAIAKSLASLGTAAAKKDESSHLQGNESAKAAIDKQVAFASELSAKLSTFVKLVNGVHNDFQVMDEEMSQDVASTGES